MPGSPATRRASVMGQAGGASLAPVPAQEQVSVFAVSECPTMLCSAARRGRLALPTHGVWPQGDAVMVLGATSSITKGFIDFKSQKEGI